jgi:hypothetical protein
MSKLTTDELVDVLLSLMEQETVVSLSTIIAKLRAADKLVVVVNRGKPYAPALVRREFETAIKEFEEAGS